MPQPRSSGVGWAVLANVCFAAGNVVSGVYPATGPLFLYRGAGATLVTASRGLHFCRRVLILGVLHTAHMLMFVVAIRIGPAWLPPALLGAGPAVLWFVDRGNDRVIDALVLTMLVVAVAFSQSPGVPVSAESVLLSGGALVLLTIRLRLAVRWSGRYHANTALAVANAIQASVGLGWAAVTGQWVFVPVLLAILVAASSIGHRAMYESAMHVSPAISAAVAPLSAVLTVFGVVLLGRPGPSITQATLGLVWLALGVFVALRAQNNHADIKRPA